jgi:hypothetical protein
MTDKIQIILIDINGQKIYPEFITVSFKNNKKKNIFFSAFSSSIKTQ